MMSSITIKKEFCNNHREIAKFQKKITHLEKGKQFRLQELEDMPDTREAIRLRADTLYIQSTIYRLKGLNRRSSSYMNQASRVIKSLDAISRFRKRKEIHNTNRSIRELEARITPLREDQVNQESTIKELLFKEFLQCGSPKVI